MRISRIIIITIFILFAAQSSFAQNVEYVGSCNTPGGAYHVFILGNYAYVAKRSYGIQIIDISNPASPTSAGDYNAPGWAYDVYVLGSYAYVPVNGSGMQIIDVSDPTSPTLVGNYYTDGALAIYIQGTYVADYYRRLYIIDVSNPASPILSGSCDTPGNSCGV